MKIRTQEIKIKLFMKKTILNVTPSKDEFGGCWIENQARKSNIVSQKELKGSIPHTIFKENVQSIYILYFTGIKENVH